jgi:hypothetical protein
MRGQDACLRAHSPLSTMVPRFLTLDMFDSDLVSKDNFLGRCVIGLSHVNSTPVGEWHDLGKRGPKSRACGRVLLVLSTDAPQDMDLWAALARARDALYVAHRCRVWVGCLL